VVCSESNSRSNVFQISRASACVPSRWKVLSGEFRRRPTALVIKFRKPDRVGRRGLSEPREDFSRLPTNAWTQKWFVQIFGSGLIRPRAQTCMDSKVVRADFWQWTDLPPGSNMLRRAAQTCSACKLAGVQIIPLPTLANQILARTFFRSVAFACPAFEKFSRASSAGPPIFARSTA
jgi:hypothetical protein